MIVKAINPNGLPAATLEKSPSTRSKILATALHVFAEAGYEGASIRAIGEAAGVSFQTIPYHFSNKETLWEQAVMAAVAETGALIRAAATSLDVLTPADRLRVQIQTLVRLTAQRPDLTRAVFREAMKDSPRYHRIFEHTSLTLFTEIRRILSEAQAAGVIKDDIDVEYLVFIIHGALFTRVLAPAESHRLTGQSMTDLEVIDKHADTIFRLLLQA